VRGGDFVATPHLCADLIDNSPFKKIRHILGTFAPVLAVWHRREAQRLKEDGPLPTFRKPQLLIF
jgi:hypothetical protein